MLEMLEKAVMTTIGVAVITQKKAEELAAELKERFKLSEDEGKSLVERIQAEQTDRPIGILQHGRDLII